MTPGARAYLHRHSSFVNRQAFIEKHLPPKTRTDVVHGYAPSTFLKVIDPTASAIRNARSVFLASVFTRRCLWDVGRKTVASIASQESGRVAVTHTMRSLSLR